jgi:hypothetical protein
MQLRSECGQAENKMFECFGGFALISIRAVIRRARDTGYTNHAGFIQGWLPLTREWPETKVVILELKEERAKGQAEGEVRLRSATVFMYASGSVLNLTHTTQRAEVASKQGPRVSRRYQLMLC